MSGMDLPLINPKFYFLAIVVTLLTLWGNLLIHIIHFLGAYIVVTVFVEVHCCPSTYLCVILWKWKVSNQKLGFSSSPSPKIISKYKEGNLQWLQNIMGSAVM